MSLNFGGEPSGRSSAIDYPALVRKLRREFVDQSGDTMTGQLTIPRATENEHAITKRQAESYLVQQKDKLEKKIQDEKKKLEDLIATTSANILITVDNNRRTLVTRIQDEITRVNQSISTLTTTINSISTTLTRDIGNVNTTLTREISNVNTSLTTNINSINTALADRVHNLEARVTGYDNQNYFITLGFTSPKFTPTKNIFIVSISVSTIPHIISRHAEGITPIINIDLDAISLTHNQIISYHITNKVYNANTVTYTFKVIIKYFSITSRNVIDTTSLTGTIRITGMLFLPLSGYSVHGGTTPRFVDLPTDTV